MTDILKSDAEYKQWLIDLKKRIRQSQLKAVVKVNSELINCNKCKTIDEALFYINKTIELGWSRNMLHTHIGLNEYN